MLSPSLHLDFTTEAGRRAARRHLQVTRASVGSEWSSNRILRPDVPANWARFDHDPATGLSLGLKGEGPRTNKCQNFNFKPDVALTNMSLKNGVGTLDTVDDSANMPFDGDAVDGQAFHVNNNEGQDVFVRIEGDPGNTSKHSFRIYCRFTGAAPTLNLWNGTAGVACNNNYEETKSENVTPFNSGDKLELIVPDGTEVWFVGNQLEEGTFVSSPIEVQGGSALRDDESIAAPAFDPNTSEFSGRIEGRTAGGLEGQNQVLYEVNDGTSNNRVSIQRRINGNIDYRVFIGGGNVLSMTLGTVADLTDIKVAFRAQANDHAAILGGGVIQTNTSVGLPGGLTDRLFMKSPAALERWFGHMRRFKEDPVPLAQSQLEALVA